MAQILATKRLRHSPFYQSTIDDGAQSFMSYNRMLLPLGYGDPVGEYWRLINGASMWDVAVERQVQLKGPDAARLAQILCVRNLSKLVVGQGKYVAICDHRGTIINDPIVMRVADDCFWLSIADSDIWFWARCIAAERGLDVQVSEPDVSPLAIQGPLAEDVAVALCGDWVRGLKHFWFKDATLEGIPLKVARSGWSKQGGFELYLLDSRHGDRLWQLVKEAGKPFDIGPGNPNHCERIESGLLSWGNDVDEATNPFEVGMGRFVDLGVDDEVIGVKALRRIKADGIKRHNLGVILEGDFLEHRHLIWYEIEAGGKVVGHMTNGVWSYRLQSMIGFALVSTTAQPGDEVLVRKEGNHVLGRLTELPFVK